MQHTMKQHPSDTAATAPSHLSPKVGGDMVGFSAYLSEPENTADS